MTQPDTSSISLIHPLDSHKDLRTASRLIVLVPPEGDYMAATRRVWEVAHTLGCHILFLTLCTDAAREASLRRQLITMSAMVQDGKISADVQVETRANWVSAVRSNLESGDTIVCFAGQRAGLWHRPLSQILQSNLKAPVYILSDLYAQRPSRSNWGSQILVWAGTIGIILGFGILQATVVQLPEAWIQNVFLILLIIPEFWLICAWHTWFR